MAISIRKALRRDLPDVIGLLREFAKFEKLDHMVEVTEEELADVLFGADAFVECLVAVDQYKLFAYAILYPSFASFRGQKGMFLEDIYVAPEYRRTGLGDQLLKEAAKLASSKGCQRIDFVVLDWNENAIKFYERHGAIRGDNERHFKFVDDAFSSLAS